MPRPRKRDQGDRPPDERMALGRAVEWKNPYGEDAPPAFLEDGAPNRGYYWFLLDCINKQMIESLHAEGKVPAGLKDAQRAVLEQAQILGFTEQMLMDRRGEGDKIEAAVTRLIEAPDGVCEVVDEVLRVLEERMDRADQVCVEYAEGKVRDRAVAEALYQQQQRESAAEERARKKAVWLERIRTLKRLKERARNPLPAERMGTDFRSSRDVGEAAACLIRYMLYVGRSDLSHLKVQGRGADILMIGRHTGKMAVDLWAAENRVGVYPWGWKVRDPDNPYQGIIMVAPPGHGKTSLGTAWCARRVSLNPYEQGIIVHAETGEACKNLAYVRTYFDAGEPAGRRNAALYSGLRLYSGEDNRKSFRLVVHHGLVRQPTVSAAGVRTKRSGASASWIWFDDPVDQREVSSDTEREKTYQFLNGTWMTRKRGQQAFELTTTTIWHADDANMRRINLARQQELRLVVSIQRCGGPKGGGTYGDRAFEPVWPEMYPESYLRAKFKEMRDPYLYAVVYQCDPRSSDDRIISQLRFYDPESEGHKEFLKKAEFWLSIDPSSTVGAMSDKAGVLYLAIGEATIPVMLEGTERQATRVVGRLLDAKAFKATQSDLVHHCATFASDQKVDKILVEVTSGFHGTVELFETHYGIRVETATPGLRNKAQRLKSVAASIDDGQTGVGGIPPPPVEFPGRYDPTTHGLSAEVGLNWFYEQILQFGNTKEDHCVDALTQWVKKVGDKLDTGRDPGDVARMIEENAKKKGYIHPRWRVIMNRLFGRGEPGKSVDGEETAFMLQS